MTSYNSPREARGDVTRQVRLTESPPRDEHVCVRDSDEPGVNTNWENQVNFFDAAVEVLIRSGRPMTTREIVKDAERMGLLETRGKTPEATMSAALYSRTSDRGGPINRTAQPGAKRAVRGSVRWELRATRPLGKSGR